MSVNFETTPIFADVASRRTDGSVLDSGSGASNANRWLLGLESTGGNSPGFHALLRFPTGTTITDTSLTVVKARLQVTASNRSTLGANVPWYVWASDLAATIALGDYNKPYNNDSITQDVLRIPIGAIFAVGATVTDGTVGEIAIPNRFIKKGTGNASDFEIRPLVTIGSLAQGANLSIYGCDAGNTTNRPRIVGVAYTDAELTSQNIYRMQAVGAESYVAIQRELTPGRAMKGSVLLDATSSTFSGHAENLESSALSRQRARPRKVAVGRSGASGDIVFEVTPEKWTSVFPGVMKYINTTDVSTLYGSGNTGVNEHNFRVGAMADVKTFTIVTRTGAFRKVYPGAMMSSFEISSNLDQPVTASCAFMARDEYTYDTDAAGSNDCNLLLGTAGYDSTSNSFLSFVGGQVSFADPSLAYVADRGTIQHFTITLRNDVQEKRGHSRTRAVTGHFPLGFRAEVSFTAYYENEVQLRKYLGIADKNFPYKAQMNINLQKVKFALAGSGGSSGFYLNDKVTPRQELIFEFPSMMYTAVATPINNEGAIMLECTGVGTYDVTTDTLGSEGAVERGNLMVTIRNTEAAAMFADPTEDITTMITVLPEGTAI